MVAAPALRCQANVALEGEVAVQQPCEPCRRTIFMAAGWELERGVETPSYALIEPESRNLNVDSLVLSCEQGPFRRGLQLRLYPSGPGTLFPQNTGDLKADPTVELAIDGASYVVQVLFADTFAVVADSADGVMQRLQMMLRQQRQCLLRRTCCSRESFWLS